MYKNVGTLLKHIYKIIFIFFLFYTSILIKRISIDYTYKNYSIPILFNLLL